METFRLECQAEAWPTVDIHTYERYKSDLHNRDHFRIFARMGPCPIRSKRFVRDLAGPGDGSESNRDRQTDGPGFLFQAEYVLYD